MDVPPRDYQTSYLQDRTTIRHDSEMEIEDYTKRKLADMAVPSNIDLPILITHLKGCIPYGRQTGIACNTIPAGNVHFTDIKVIHNGTVHHKRPYVRDNPQGSVALDEFQK